ncbi:cell wall hydrolase, partial [Ruegeria sp. HKCCD8929]|uniref:cell wall hydrolase n=1 Tax=Ruegeria sp. HKCCD8929 TaxID=2683006 RepID=UPI001C2BE195
GQGAAMEAGRETATGNISLANASMNNMAANKYNTSSLYDTGLATRRLADGALHHRNADGSETYSGGTAQSTGGMSTRVGQTIREEVSDRKDAAIRTATSARDEWSTAVNETAADYADFGRSLSSGTSVGDDASSSSSSRRIKDAREAHQAVEDFSKQHGISVNAAYKLALSGGTPGGSPIDAKIGADITGLDTDSYERLSKAARESGLSETVSKFAEASHSVRAGQQSSETNTESGGNRWSIEDVRRLGNTYAEAREEAETLSAAEAHLYSKGINYDQELRTAIENEWREAGFSKEQISALAYPKTRAAIRRQEKAVEQVLPGLLEELGIDRPTPDLTSAFTLSRPQQEITTQQLPSAGTEHRAELQRVTGATKKLEGAIGERQQVLEGKATAGAASNERQVVEGQDFGVIPGIGAKAVSTGGDVLDSAMDLGRGVKNTLTGSDSLSYYDRDVMIRTIAGEAGRESDLGQAAVAHVILNRVQDPRWGDNPAEVSLELKQFSAWNSGSGGNKQPESLKESDPAYERIGRIVDAVAAGEIEDPTGGATHYYSPDGMRALVAAGEQENETPTWVAGVSRERGGENVVIGRHIFTGRRRNE